MDSSWPPRGPQHCLDSHHTRLNGQPQHTYMMHPCFGMKKSELPKGAPAKILLYCIKATSNAAAFIISWMHSYTHRAASRGIECTWILPGRVGFFRRGAGELRMPCTLPKPWQSLWVKSLQRSSRRPRGAPTFSTASSYQGNKSCRNRNPKSSC